MRDVDRRKAAGDAAELGADRLDRQLKSRDRDRAEDQRHDRAGHARQPPRHEQDERQRADAQRQRRRMERVHRLDEQFHAREKLARWVTDAQAEEVFDLGGGDQQGDAVGEAEDDGPRDELDRLAEAGDRQEQQDDARHHRDHQQAGQAVRGDDAGDDHHERARRSADLDARAAEEGHHESADDGRVDARLRGDARCDPERHRQRQRDDAHRQAGDHIGDECSAVIGGEILKQLRLPGSPRNAIKQCAHTRRSCSGSISPSMARVSLR